MSKEKQQTKLRQLRNKVKRLKDQNSKLRNKLYEKICSDGQALNEKCSKDIAKLIEETTPEINEQTKPGSFKRLFWEEQLKYNSCKSPHAMRWHPMIIRWALSLKQKSTTAYRTLRESKVIALPSETTLYDYSHFIPAESGFQNDVIEMLTSEAEKAGLYEEEHKQYVGLLADEIKIKEDLVYDASTGELIGFINLDEVGNALDRLENLLSEDKVDKKPDRATHMLVVMLRGATTNFKFPLVCYPTKTATSPVLFSILWKAIEYVELHAGLHVLFVTCDGASPNRRFFKLHKEGNEDIVYSAQNPYPGGAERIMFVSDVPHLIKTARNCFANSFSHKRTRQLWKDGKTISWIHIVELYETYIESTTYSEAPKLTRAHIDLTAFSRMKVNLAAQVLSNTVANALERNFGDHMSETVKFLRLMDRFFDCCNTRSLYEAKQTLKGDLSAYTEADDARLTFLMTEFIQYIDDWETSVENRPGNFTQTEKNGMQLSYQTKQGLKISVQSIVHYVKFFLNKGAKFVLTENFNQDPLEQMFGHCRRRLGCNSDPTAYEMQHNVNQLRVTGSASLAGVNGNCKRFQKDREITVDDSPIPRKKPRKQ